jgi:hypothetical protein
MGGYLAAFAAAGAMLLAAATAQAAIFPASPGAHLGPNVQLTWCAVGAHIGPLGACIGGPGWGSGYGPGYYHHCWHNRWGQRVCN